MLAHKGVKDVKKFSSTELAEIRARATAQQKRNNAEVQKLGLPAKLVRCALRRVGQRIVTAPLMLIPGKL